MSNGTSISSDLINRRLGGSGGQKAFYEAELPASAYDESDGSGLSAGFIVKMVVLFLSVGGGTFFFDASGFSWYEVKLAIGDLSGLRL